MLIILCVILAITLILTTVAVVLVMKGRSELFDVELDIAQPKIADVLVQDSGDYITYKGRTYKYNCDVTNILFMGVDKRNIDGLSDTGTGGQADVIVMIAINVKDHKMTMIALPRDTMAEVKRYTPNGTYNGISTMQVCLAYAFGNGRETSCENTVESVRNVFYNIPVKTYYALDLDGIAAMNDAVGGVDVTSPETIDEFVEGENYHLEGRASERFVRSRDKSKLDSSMQRLERQRIYAKSFLTKMQSSLKNNPTSALTLFNDSSPYSCTSLTAAKVTYLARELMFGGSMKTDIITVAGNMTYNGELAEYVIDENAFFEQFLSVYYEKV